uniref:PID domain-containing protein n=1 Tax=Trichuris muris TaxID=70415 RepID=A0A5S6QNZ2_TRIMR
MVGLRKIARLVATSLDRSERSSFYVWFFGFKALSINAAASDDALTAEVAAAIAATIKVVPIKLTLEISRAGVRLVQPYLLVNRRGRVRTLLVKRHLVAHSILSCALGSIPYHDFVAIFRVAPCADPKVQPTELIVVRCDSPETAFRLHSSIGSLILMPQGRSALRSRIDDSSSPSGYSSKIPMKPLPSRQLPDRPPLSLRSRTLYRMLVVELKTKIQCQRECGLTGSKKRTLHSDSRQQSFVRPSETKVPFLRFGDSVEDVCQPGKGRTPSFPSCPFKESAPVTTCASTSGLSIGQRNEEDRPLVAGRASSLPCVRKRYFARSSWSKCETDSQTASAN